MNTDAPQKNDLGLSFQERIDILFHEIELAVKWDRPSILFAIYKSDSIRDKVNTILREKLKNISQDTYSIRTNNSNQFDFLSEISQLPKLSQLVLLIEGFKWDCGTEGVGVFAEFNKHREYFIDNNIRAIFWLFESEVSDFAANATECWMLRHRVVEFVDVLQENQVFNKSLDSLWQGADNSLADEYLPVNSNEDILNFQKSKNIEPSHANALLSLGILFWRKGNLIKALKYLQASSQMSILLANHSLQAQCQNALALVHTELGTTEEAISAYQHAISLSPESGFLWNNLGQLLAKNDRNEEAINSYKKALSCSPQDFLSWDGLGQIFIKLGVYQNAISAFEKALEIAPYFEFSLVGIGRAYLESGQVERAIGSFRKAVEINPYSIDAWINLGECFAQQKRDLDVIAVYHKAIEFNPQSANLWDALGTHHLQRQDFSESIFEFQKTISLDPQNGEPYLRLAYALFQIGDFETSASIYKDSIPLFKNDVICAELWIHLGDTYLKMKDYEKALAAYEQSDQLKNGIKISGDKEIKLIDEIHNSDFHADREIEQDLSVIDRGEEMNEANHEFDLKTATEWNALGNSHLKAGAYNDAIIAYTKAIELSPNACWPYIQNLAYVHYQKGKAKGKLSIGKMEDPDIWEGEDEPDSASLFGFETIPNSEQNEAILEPGLEKPNRNNVTSEPVASTDTGMAKLNISDSCESCPNEKNVTILVPAEEASNSLTGISNTKNKVIQKVESEVNVPFQNLNPPLPVEDTPQNSIDWNELGNSYAASRKYDNAIEAYKKAIEMNPKYGQPYRNLGHLYYRLKKYDVAVQLYKRSIDLLDTQEEKAVSWNRLGDTYRRMGDYGNASSAYQRAGEMGPAVSTEMARARVTLLENIVAG